MLDDRDNELVLLLATSSASLDRSPKKNWVENAGGLPPYIRKLARAIEKSGKSLDSAIAIAISRVKAWAAGGDDVDADTRAKAAKALAQWEALKAKSAMKLTHPSGEEYLMFSSVQSFNTEIVRAAWSSSRPKGSYSWIRELGTDYIIIEEELESGSGPVSYPRTFRIPYSVDENETVVFGDPKRVVQIWVEKDELTAVELSALRADLESPLDRIIETAKTLR